MNRLWKLIREFEIKYGRMPFGKELDQLKILANEEETRQKVIRIPEEKFPPFYEARPMEGPKAEVKQFPKEKIVRKPSETTEAGGLERIAKELEDMQEIGKDYKDTSVSDFLSDYFDMPKKSKTPVKDKMQKMLGDVKLYGDETFEELEIIKNTGEHPRDKKAYGGRIKNNDGGLNSLKEVYNNVGDFVSKYSGLDSLIKLVEYLDTVGTPEYTADPFNTKPLKRPMRAPKLPEKKSEGLDYLQGF